MTLTLKCNSPAPACPWHSIPPLNAGVRHADDPGSFHRQWRRSVHPSPPQTPIHPSFIVYSSYTGAHTDMWARGREDRLRRRRRKQGDKALRCGNSSSVTGGGRGDFVRELHSRHQRRSGRPRDGLGSHPPRRTGRRPREESGSLVKLGVSPTTREGSQCQS